MAIHPMDFEIYSHIISTPEMQEIFDERRRIQRWLDIEAALARAQGELGVIPEQAANEIGRKARFDLLDKQAIGASYKKMRQTIMPVLKELKRTCDGDAGQYVHFGATTQDILDTAEVLEAKDALAIIYRDLRELEEKLLELAGRYKETPMIGRTHGQHALPITFGLKVSVWVRECRRHLERIKACAERLLVGQLSGGVGTQAAFGPLAPRIAEKTLACLGLKTPLVTWHSSRDNPAELASVLAMICSTLGKIANEVVQLQKTETGELAEPSSAERVGSSTMPHKRNPFRSQRVVSISRQVKYLAAQAIEYMQQEHERDTRALSAEWIVIPEVCIYTGASLRHMLGIISGLEVYPRRMLKNLHLQKDMILSEWLLFHFGKVLGKMEAHDKLHKLSKSALATGKSLKEAILEDPRLKDLLSPEDVDYLSHPERYLGMSKEIVEQVIARTTADRKTDPVRLTPPPQE